ncbi:MAG: tRNA (adenosine(37)-N6)-threonylcarbamoyltransferase complex ATPase subunit type 1 TsaE [Ginsengibacter sp.]
MEFDFELKDIRPAAIKFFQECGHYTKYAFTGELGAGKTTFISSLCKELGVEEVVTSPTYSIIQEYTTLSGKAIYHIDLYRIKSEQEAMDSGIEDCLNSREICLAEWPEKAPGIFPEDTVFTTIRILSPHKRKLIVKLP